jgi:hypothetical protein
LNGKLSQFFSICAVPLPNSLNLSLPELFYANVKPNIAEKYEGGMIWARDIAVAANCHSGCRRRE